MDNQHKFYIDGQWVEPRGNRTLDVIDPSTEAPIASIALGNPDDVDRAVAAARSAFDGYSRTSVGDRLALLDKLIATFEPNGLTAGDYVLQVAVQDITSGKQQSSSLPITIR